MIVRFKDELRKEAEQFYQNNQHHGRMVFSVHGSSEIWGRGEYDPDMNISRIMYPTDLLMIHELEVIAYTPDPHFFISMYPYKDIQIYKDHVYYVHKDYDNMGRELTDIARMCEVDIRMLHEQRLRDEMFEFTLPPLEIAKNTLWDKTIEELF